MNRSTLRNLGIVLFALIAILIGLEMSDREHPVSNGDTLFADLKARLNDVTSVTVERAQAEPVVLSNASGTWTVSNRDDFPASVAKIREVLVAIADARILEEKTANPERYARLGVNDPEAEDSKGVRVTLAADGVEYSVIIGDVNQGRNRYVRIAGDAQSLLIDQNPALPDDAGGWLRNDVVDIDPSDLRSASIRHADGETIRIEKAARGAADFTVPDMPEGRELSYPTSANSIGGALNDLTLDDVRRATGGDPDTTTDFETFDGLRLTVAATRSDGESWISLRADAVEAPPAEAGAETAPAEADTEAEGDAAEPPAEDAAARAAALNARLEGWEFRIPEFKANQLTRRWDDILKTEEE